MILVYASTKCREAVAFSCGLSAIGVQSKILTASDYGRGQVIPCEAVVISGTRGKGAVILSDHEAVGIPVIVIDYGYLRRVSGMASWETGHWQVGVGGLNRPPAFDCSPDRFNSLELQISRPTLGGCTIVLGQHSGDPSHGMTDGQMAAWGRAACNETGGYWRPHPDSQHIDVDAPRADGPFSEWLGRAGLVRTVCSTGGLEALIAGIPAVADMPDMASWGALSGTIHPGKNAVKSLCNRLAYGQWTLDEMRSGLAPEFVLSNMRRWNEQRPKDSI